VKTKGVEREREGGGRERGREREGERGRERGREGESERERLLYWAEEHHFVPSLRRLVLLVGSLG